MEKNIDLKGIVYCKKDGQQVDISNLSEEELKAVCMELHRLCFKALVMQQGYELINFKPEE